MRGNRIEIGNGGASVVQFGAPQTRYRFGSSRKGTVGWLVFANGSFRAFAARSAMNLTGPIDRWLLVFYTVDPRGWIREHSTLLE
jgi:hypothetical protein